MNNLRKEDLSPVCRWCETSKVEGVSYDDLATFEYLEIANITDGICEKCEAVMMKEIDEYTPEDFEKDVVDDQTTC